MCRRRRRCGNRGRRRLDRNVRVLVGMSEVCIRGIRLRNVGSYAAELSRGIGDGLHGTWSMFRTFIT